MPFTGDTFAHLFDWEKDPQRQEKIVNSRLEAEFDGVDTALSTLKGAGYVVGPAGVTDSRPALFDGTTGKLLKQHTALLGTAAAQNTGTSGANIPFLNGANTWSGKQTLSDGTTLPLIITRSANTVGPFIASDHIAGTAANGDTIGGWIMTARNSSGTSYQAGGFSCGAADVTAGSEDTRFQFNTIVAGGTGGRLFITDGIFTANATGGSQGLDTINAKAVYDDSVILTPVPQEWAETGKIDLEKFDALVPDQKIMEQKRWEAVTEKRRVPVEALERVDGGFVRKTSLQEIEAPVFEELSPIWDEDGNGIGAHEVQKMREVVEVEAATVPRQHYTARIFKEMIDAGFDPRDPAQFMAKVMADKALPGMPTETEWLARKSKISVGEMHTRSVLAMEILTQAVGGLLKRVEALESQKPRLR